MAINYKDIELAFDFVNFGQPYEHEAYLNLYTGETYWHSEIGDNEEELPDDIDDETKYIPLPHKNDLNLDKKLVLKFAYQYLPDDAEKVENIFGHKGAYSRFKDILETKGKVEEWYEYESKAAEKALREWCKINEIKING
ncbi:MAG: hypothetical protein HOM14_02145 [Gammaproteobacteria bacterium]|jgi:hypothetical protein|nr:hypothetical protein [Gammaproteobacteria bacterium]MBT3724694.1 hypothetical protein [Gammaproteobacteria bacterium]MBT4192799.1 hypothetical protein [Gammaproteobacteria bacterium]MBT4448720.1 hypothetical protein [Gammaproteobacteria bacterium]MBT4862604.1 hypothetical protein [Gammaproteobacteria bacterium]